MAARIRISVAISALAWLGACSHHRADEPVGAPAPARDSASVISIPSASGNPSQQAREYRGAYSSAFEVSWFEPCGAPFGDNVWWVTLTEEARLERDSLVKRLPRKPTAGLAVRWRGTVRDRLPAGAGQMGRGSRYMLVTTVLSVRALGTEGACTGEDHES